MRNTSYWTGKNGPMLIAEIGGNHEGNFNYAKKLVKLAISSGVDVVKFQIYEGESLVSKIESKKRFKHFKKFQLTKKQHLEIAELCKKAKIQYLASVWDIKSLKWIDKYLAFYKIGSGDLTAYPVIKEICKRKKPIILSTGLSTLREIKKTISYIKKENSFYKNYKNLSLLQCTASYPTPDNEVNLKVINTLRNETKLSIGYSHHNTGDTALISAYLLGAEILEFHFTDTRKDKIFRDHKISLTHKETKILIEKIKRINILKGVDIKTPTKSEIKSKNIKTFRRAIYLNKNIKKGQTIKKNDIVCLRPNNGIDARDFMKIIGKKASKNIFAYKKIFI